MQIIIEPVGAVLHVRFNRPDKKHAITSQMYADMVAALQAADQNAAIRAVYFQGQPNFFTAGNDLEDFLRSPPQSSDAPIVQFLFALSQFGKPMVASVQGPAVGIGTTLLLHCDLVYAADNARFSMPFTSLGLCPEAASSLLLPLVAGYQRAAEKLLLGEWFDVFEAQQMGLINKVLPVEEVDGYAQNQLAKLVALPPAAIRATRQLLRHTHADAVQQRLREEVEMFSKLLQAPEAREAFNAFFEKRKPDFSKFS